jgi:dihydropteroate synthase
VKTILVGVLNVTPDSFSDGGRFVDPQAAAAHALHMAAEGAAWIDVGGESTRPGSAPVSEDEEQARVLPVLRALSGRIPPGVRLSIDTYKAATAAAALAAGATVVNDVSGGVLEPEILRVAARAGATLLLGHMRGRPATMMDEVDFADPAGEVASELSDRVEAARRAGCAHIWVDPGIGFGKGLRENLQILANLRALRTAVGVPMMVGVSRKRFVGELTGRDVTERDFGTAAAVAVAILAGVEAVRVHDVGRMSDVVKVAEAIASTTR